MTRKKKRKPNEIPVSVARAMEELCFEDISSREKLKERYQEFRSGQKNEVILKAINDAYGVLVSWLVDQERNNTKI